MLATVRACRRGGYRETPCEAKLSHWAEVSPQGQPKAAAAWRRMLHAHTVYKLPPVLRAVHGRWRERRGRGMTRRAMRRRKPPRRRSSTNKRSMAWRRGLDPTSGRENRQPGPRQYLKQGDGLLRLFCSSTCWPGLTRTSLLGRSSHARGAGRGPRQLHRGLRQRGTSPSFSGDHRQLRQTAEGRQQRGERETQKGPRVLSPARRRPSTEKEDQRERERVAVACANGAMQARDSSTRQRIKALLHVPSISLCSVSPPLAPPPPPSTSSSSAMETVAGYVREGTRPTGQALLLLAGDDVWVRRNVTSGPQVESGRCSQTRLGLPIDDWARFYRMATPQPGQDGAS